MDYLYVAESIAIQLYRYRKIRGYSHETVQNMSGLTPKTIRELENIEGSGLKMSRGSSLKTIVRYASCLGLDVEVVLREKKK